MFEIRYGTPERFKTITTSDEVQAYRMYDHIEKFAVSHKLLWSISLWDRGWKVKSVTFK